MNIQFFIDQLTRGAVAIRSMVEDLDDAQVRWKPADDKWSVLEIVCHLADEEREDFRMRLELTLSDPRAEWPPIDPAGIVVARAYNSRKLSDALSAYLREREASIAWLTSLDEPDLATEHVHPEFGSMSAGNLLASWVAHDLLHIRQIARVEYQYVEKTAAPYSLEYAGPP